MTDALAVVADRFGLGGVLHGHPIAEGLSNPNWKLTTTTGAYAVKQLRDATAEAVRHQHRVLPRLAGLGLPVPLPCATPAGGRTVVPVGDHWYAASPWLPGTHRTGCELDLDACADLGDLLARVHEGLVEVLPPAPPPARDPAPTVAGAAASLARYAGLAAAPTTPGPFDDFAVAEIAWRAALLDQVADRRPGDDPVARTGWTHGDVQHLNLLFTGDTVTAVLDWDRLGVRALGLEVVRTGTIMFATGDERGIDLDRIAAFVRAYRRRIPLDDADLADAAHRRWWRLVCATWPLRLHYDEGDWGCDHLYVSIGQVLRWWTGHFADLTAALTVGSRPARRR